MVLDVFIIVGVAIIGLAIYLFVKTPNLVVIRRSQAIRASVESLFPYINNPRQIQLWNPFTSGDPAVAIDYMGPTDGIGAQWAWKGPKAGIGQAIIIESKTNEYVGLRIDFKKPFYVTNKGEYALVQKDDKVEVIWAIYESALIPRLISVFINLEKVIGVEFEKGLLKLKILAEQNPDGVSP